MLPDPGKQEWDCSFRNRSGQRLLDTITFEDWNREPLIFFNFITFNQRTTPSSGELAVA